MVASLIIHRTEFEENFESVIKLLMEKTLSVNTSIPEERKKVV